MARVENDLGTMIVSCGSLNRYHEYLQQAIVAVDFRHVGLWIPSPPKKFCSPCKIVRADDEPCHCGEMNHEICSAWFVELGLLLPAPLDTCGGPKRAFFFCTYSHFVG